LAQTQLLWGGIMSDIYSDAIKPGFLSLIPVKSAILTDFRVFCLLEKAQ
jgi:hypothetical protein